ncbi:L-serine ammonia-lyase, iron-sulfur-dependent subunit beta [Tepidibacillus fermentans]|uniref:L-serine deaminase n=1 Tax=Tepidibacillus fermentans TaxID=1281767 RepID=A0A4R3KKE4_9BACI|nr:L-serine ammonia-lyase, iron-sulfur-dependent subunit beta [Tepidibacillus fermentans]TCS84343.1 L-serine dehydratase [Tepidibacillus fermentans]
MKYHSVFDIIGPIMIGPSSSHTAGAARIGKAARSLFARQPKKAIITLYGSFAKTYKGHGTDVAIVGGILGFDTYDNRIVDSLVIAKDLGIEIQVIPSNEQSEHPNTARIYLEDEKGTLEIVGVSIGGGKVEIVEIQGFKIKVSGNQPSLIVFHEDRHGVIASVSTTLSKFEINIGYMEVARKEKGSIAMMVIETDQRITREVLNELESLKAVRQVALLKTS